MPYYQLDSACEIAVQRLSVHVCLCWRRMRRTRRVTVSSENIWSATCDVVCSLFFSVTPTRITSMPTTVKILSIFHNQRDVITRSPHLMLYCSVVNLSIINSSECISSSVVHTFTLHTFIRPHNRLRLSYQVMYLSPASIKWYVLCTLVISSHAYCVFGVKK